MPLHEATVETGIYHLTLVFQALVLMPPDGSTPTYGS
jgi:hypothetical protein